MSRKFNCGMGNGFYMDKARKENDKYSGLLSGRQRRDLESDTDLTIFGYTKAEKERDAKIKMMGVGSNFHAGSFGNICGLGKHYNTGDGDNKKSIAQEKDEYMRKVRIDSLVKYSEQKEKRKAQ